MPTISEAELCEVASALATQLQPGACVLFYGPVGVGKTTFISHLVHTLGASVASPTFSLVHQYPTIPPIFHLDLYRLETASDLSSIDLDRYLDDPHHVVLVEWAERLGERTPDRHLRIELHFTDSNHRRHLMMTDVVPKTPPC